MTTPGIQLSRSLRDHTLPLLLAMFSLAAAVAGDDLSRLLRFDRASIAGGEWWRLFSGNIVHLGWSHLLMNLAGLALIWALFHRQYTTLSWLAIGLASALGVTAGLWLFTPELNWYVGLSGLLHGLFAAGTVASIRRGERWGYLLLLGITAKLIYEGLIGPVPGTSAIAGGAIVEQAHLYGAVAGAATAMLLGPAGTSGRQTRATT